MKDGQNKQPAIQENTQCPVRIDQFGNWQSQGIIMWSESRRIVHVEFFNGDWFVWCDGSMTAIPADEIICD